MPGHTLGAVGWRLHRLPRLHVTQGQPAGEDPDDVFTGDTLFGAGCGRLFEGSAAQLHASLAALLELPDATRLWFGHEYTASNLRFARTVAPDDAALLARERCLTPCTTPTTVALERATNPFARAPTASHLASLRHAKDNF
jgi:hydroxyacylglutathione hydrolase